MSVITTESLINDIKHYKRFVFDYKQQKSLQTINLSHLSVYDIVKVDITYPPCIIFKDSRSGNYLQLTDFARIEKEVLLNGACVYKFIFNPGQRKFLKSPTPNNLVIVAV